MYHAQLIRTSGPPRAEARGESLPPRLRFESVNLIYFKLFIAPYYVPPRKLFHYDFTGIIPNYPGTIIILLLPILILGGI